MPAGRPTSILRQGIIALMTFPPLILAGDPPFIAVCRFCSLPRRTLATCLVAVCLWLLLLLLHLLLLSSPPCDNRRRTPPPPHQSPIIITVLQLSRYSPGTEPRPSLAPGCCLVLSAVMSPRVSHACRRRLPFVSRQPPASLSRRHLGTGSLLRPGRPPAWLSTPAVSFNTIAVSRTDRSGVDHSL